MIDTTYEELARYDVPVILTGKSGPIAHSVALLGLEGGVVTIGDPLTGLMTTRIEELGKTYEWSGQAILIQPAGSLPAIRPHLKRCGAGPSACGPYQTLFHGADARPLNAHLLSSIGSPSSVIRSRESKLNRPD